MSNTFISDSFKAREEKNRLNSFAVEQMHKKCLPVGSIVMWNGTQIPNGWGLCNGTVYQKINGTGPIISPDLRGKFVLSFGQGGLDFANNTIGATGGAQKVTLTTNEMPSHSHTQTSLNDDFNNSGEYANYTRPSFPQSDSTGAVTWTNTINPTGGNAAHENMPPYYVLAYIIKL
jgi:microcystin-dependent protein